MGGRQLADSITKNWLQDLAYRTNLMAWIFMLSAGLALFVALVRVSFQSIRASLPNPMDSLRYE